MIILILLASIASAADVKDKEIADDWFYYKDVIEKDGSTYNLRAVNAEGGESADPFLHLNKNDSLKMQIPYGTCEITDAYKYCFDNLSFEEEKVDIDPNGNLQPAIYVRLIEFDLSPHIEIEREFEKTSMSMFEETEVIITVENIGNINLYNLRLNEVVPEGFEIVSSEQGLQYTNNTAYATFNLLEGKEWTRKYKLKANTFEDGEYKTSIVYDTDEKKNLEIESKNQKITVVDPYELTYTEFKKAIDTKTRVKFEITIENTDDEPISVENLEVTVPLGMSHILPNKMSKKEPYNYEYSGTVDEGDTEIIGVSAFAPWEGNFTFNFAGAIIVKGERFSFRKEATAKIETEGLNCFFKFNNLTATAGQKIKYTAYIKNNDDITLYNINASINTLDGETEFNYNSITQDEENLILTKEILLPFSLEDSDYNFNITGTYNTDSGQEFNLECDQEYKAKKAKKLINLILESNNTEAKRGDSVEITVKTENALDTRVDGITVYQDQGDESEKIEYLLGGRSKTAYTYIIKIPDKEESDKLSFKTFVEVEEHGYKDSETIDIVVTDPYVSQDDSSQDNGEDSNANSNSDDDNNNNNNNSETEEEPDGFFAKIIYLIKTIFS